MQKLALRRDGVNGEIIDVMDSMHPAKILEKCVAEAYELLGICKQSRMHKKKVCAKTVSGEKVILYTWIGENDSCHVNIQLSNTGLIATIGEDEQSVFSGGIIDLYKDYAQHTLGIKLILDPPAQLWAFNLQQNKEAFLSYINEYNKLLSLLSNIHGKMLCVAFDDSRLAIIRLPSHLYVAVATNSLKHGGWATAVLISDQPIIGINVSRIDGKRHVYFAGPHFVHMLEYIPKDQLIKTIVDLVNNIVSRAKKDKRLREKMDTTKLTKLLMLMILNTIYGKRCVHV